MSLIYVADDDKNIRELFDANLKNDGFIVKTFENGKYLLETFKSVPCDLIVTDIMMPVMGGYDLCKEIRRISMVPVFMISANNDEIDRVLGIELGSDDYISKPISFREISARIKNALRRQELLSNSNERKGSENIIRFQELVINKSSREVYVNDTKLELTKKEYDVLELFMSNINIAFSREQIIEKVWGYDYFGDSRQVDHIVKRVRKKILEVSEVTRITTIWGYGYKLGDE